MKTERGRVGRISMEGVVMVTPKTGWPAWRRARTGLCQVGWSLMSLRFWRIAGRLRQDVRASGANDG
ncbi:MAG: hypothetical protein WDO73_19380 [Ignavibacteriota bacterium]